MPMSSLLQGDARYIFDGLIEERVQLREKSGESTRDIDVLDSLLDLCEDKSEDISLNHIKNLLLVPLLLHHAYIILGFFLCPRYSFPFPFSFFLKITRAAAHSQFFQDLQLFSMKRFF